MSDAYNKNSDNAERMLCDYISPDAPPQKPPNAAVACV